MIRGFAALFVVLAGSTLARAQGVDGVIQLTIPPAPLPSPALRYRLLPELRDRTPGNAAQLYYRAFAPEWATHRQPEVRKLIYAWLDDRTQPPDPQLRWIVDSKQLKEVDRAARRDYCDWELTPRLREDGISMLLPDVQGFREYSHLLSLRTRFQIADGKLDDAVYTLQTGFALARDVANAPTLIQVLVGLAIAQMQIGDVEAVMQAPKSPNLYWALTNLPRPLVSLRTSLEGERIMMDSVFPGMREILRKSRSKVLAAEEVQALVEKLAPVVLMEGKVQPPDARKTLVENAN